MVAPEVEAIKAGHAAVWSLDAGSQKPFAGAGNLRQQTASVTERPAIHPGARMPKGE
jgi:hypothetical protein